MSRHIRVLFAAFLSTAIFCAAPPVFSQANSSATVPVTTTVTVLGPKFTPAPPISKQDVSAYSGKERLNVTKWVPAQGPAGALQLAVVIDNDASELGVASQLSDIKNFISLQSKDTAIGLFYAMYGSVQVAAPFGANRAARGQSLAASLGIAERRFSQHLSLAQRSGETSLALRGGPPRSPAHLERRR